MKIICAGYPKTATKSCTKCLTHYGYKVADVLENAEMGQLWYDYINGQCSIADILSEYDMGYKLFIRFLLILMLLFKFINT